MDATDTPNPITERKNAVRASMRAQLQALTDAERAARSTAACARILKSTAFQSAVCVMLYTPLRSEIDVMSVALEAFRLGKVVCVPRVADGGKSMHAVEIKSIDDESMTSDALGVPAPRSGREIMHESIDLVIAPGVAFDVRGGRLGRGGGFYDRFLAKAHRHTATIGVCFDFQLLDEIPTEADDIPVQAVVTDRRGVERSGSHSVLASSAQPNTQQFNGA
jgi:5-formyltetrahydrofolate cyclo-ligase